MRRVVVSGIGIVSCLGNDINTVSQALQQGKSGIRYQEEYAVMGLRSLVAGVPETRDLMPIPRKHRRFMADAALYAYHAANLAIADSQLTPSLLSHPRSGVVIGSGVGSPWEHLHAMDDLRKQGVHKILPYSVPRIMGSTASASLATAFNIQGISCSMSSACASSGHAIGYGAELIQFGKQDIVIVGGTEETSWATTAPFDAMGALSVKYNNATASRPYDIDRDGFVIAGGAGILVLEELEHARARRAPIYAEISGFGACSDGMDMVTPSAEGAARAMRLALGTEDIADIDYINAHATSTPLGDMTELDAIRRVFPDKIPLISSTKGLTGHPIGAAAAHEAIYAILMMRDGFIAGCANLDTPDPLIGNLPVLRHTIRQPVQRVLSNSFGFGGTNVSLLLQSL